MELAAGGSAFFPIDIEQEDAEEERQRAERDSGDVAALKQHIARLEQRVVSQEAAFNEASQRFLQKKTRAQTRQRELQNTVEQLVKRVEAQDKLLEEERARFQTKQASAKKALTQLSESFNALLPQVQGILDGDESAAEPPGDPSDNEGHDRLPPTQQPIPIDLLHAQSEHDQEQAQQAKDALAAYREVTQRYFMQREELLTCPISFDLFNDPVTTSCCGKTFSNESLTMTFASYPVCPVCRTRVLTTTRSRDVAALVELHQQERAAVEALENTPAQETDAASENAVAPAAARQTARQTANREHRTARAGARSATTRRQRGRRAPQ